MPTNQVAVITTPPNEHSYEVYIGNDGLTIDKMEHLGTFPFDTFDITTVIALENYLAQWGYLVDEWKAETPEYRVAAIVEFIN